jgi:hypothetical protein
VTDDQQEHSPYGGERVNSRPSIAITPSSSIKARQKNKVARGQQIVERDR